DLHSLSIRVVHTDLDRRGGFECSDPVLNAIQRNAEWSTLTNYHGIPTDCPHREKNGWTGDAQLSAEQVLLNFAPMTAYIKWMQDFVDIQRPSGQLPGIIPTGGWGFNWGSGPAWDSAIVLIPWYIYVYCGDTGILERMYEPIRKYVDYMTSMSSGHIVDFGLGDWCPPEAKKVGNCPTVVTDTAYYYTDARILSRIGEILGKSEEAARYRELATNIRNAFRERFLARENGQLTGMTAGNSQTALSCALFQGMAEPEEAEVLAGFLVQEVERCGYHIDSGILGAKYVMHALTEAGRTDLAYRNAVNPEYPGWGNWIARGATTLWEDWEGRSSLNHHMFSDISAWFYKALAGIRPDPDHPGFRHFFVCPGPVEGLTWVKAWHHCGYGRIDCSWQIVDGEFKLTLKVPVGCIATLQLPQGCCGDVEISLPDGSMEVRPADETLLQPAGGKAGQGYMAGPGEWMIRCEIIDASHKDE
ncbi:MAG TPA: hypothetical protein DD727_01860, partial [Clostridiales bacterium]|nr:hypothetical protein [Clostridiales bacterium]